MTVTRTAGHARGISVYRQKARTAPFTPDQRATQTTFRGGSEFAKLVKADPALLKLYRTRGRNRKLRCNYRQMAISDFFEGPRIVGLDTHFFHPLRGGVLTVAAVDNFEVVRVAVTLRDEAGEVVVEGDARHDGSGWHFDVPPAANHPAATVDVIAWDRPGNVATKTFTVPERRPATAIAPPPAAPVAATPAPVPSEATLFIDPDVRAN